MNIADGLAALVATAIFAAMLTAALGILLAVLA